MLRSLLIKQSADLRQVVKQVKPESPPQAGFPLFDDLFFSHQHIGTEFTLSDSVVMEFNQRMTGIGV